MAPPLAARLAPLPRLLLLAALGLRLGLAGPTPPPASGRCDLLGDGAEESAAEWALLERLRPLWGKRFTVETVNATTQESYVYNFRLCDSVLPGDPTAGLVQVKGKESHSAKVIGRTNSTQAIGGSDWILLFFGDGDPYKSHCQGERRKALVMISCEPGVVSAGFKVILEQREKVSDCFYLFEMDSSLACPRTVKKLSTGSVLLILFVTLLCLYLLGGFLYQRLVVKAKGIEQFPNHSFWQELGNLTADGCDFVFRSKSQSPPPSYRGVGSQPLGGADEEEEERDEHLLPM